MIVTLKTSSIPTLEQIRAFLEGSQPFERQIPDREQAYAFIADTLRGLRYPRLKRPDKRAVRRYLVKVFGFSRQQLTRLIAQFRRQGRLEDRRGKPAKPFARRYTQADILTLADLDALHGTLSGPANKKLCERAFQVFGEARYERLAKISNGHLYNLRQAALDRRQRVAVEKTRSVKLTIGERRQSSPQEASPATCVSTVSIRAISMASRACISSTPSMRSPSSNSSPPSNGSANPSCSLSWNG